MKFKKLIVAFCSLAALFTSACGGSGPEEDVVGGLEFTYVSIDFCVSDNPTYEFKYEGSNPVVYWSDGAINTSTSHTFRSHWGNSFMIFGDITSISFCDENGECLKPDNANIQTVYLSKTIEKIPSKAFYSIGDLETVVIPSSVKTIGAYAFACNRVTMFFCGASSKPSGWDNLWDANLTYENVHIWKTAFYYNEDDYSFYILINNEGYHTAYLAFYRNFDRSKDLKLEIPNTISTNTTEYAVRGIMGGAFDDSIKYDLKEITFNSNLEVIMNGTFKYCEKLEKINFNDSHLESIGEEAFSNTGLKEVTIPASVHRIGEEAFANNKDLLTVDVSNYQSVKSIALCNSTAFNQRDDHQPITFKYNASLNAENFIAKGWPKEDGKFIWQQKSSLSI